jgi:hypothetical protein
MSQVYSNAGRTGVDSGWAIKHGLIGGFIAGIIFAMGEMIEAWVVKGNPILPMHMIAGIPLQQEPMKIDPTTAIIVGMIAHMLYSMVVGVIVAFIIAAVPALRTSAVVTVVFTIVLGFLAWPLNFFIIAPLINAPWMPRDTNPVMQAIWDALFGLVLGLYLASQLPRTVSTDMPGAPPTPRTVG